MNNIFNYNNAFSVDSKNLLSTMVLLILGIFIAAAYTTFIKKFKGEFVLSLIRSEAFDEASAKSLSELGIEKNFFKKLVLKNTLSFSPDYFVVKGETEKYFVDREYIQKLEAKYGNTGITIVHLFITLIAFFSVALVLASVIPGILNMFNF